MPRPVALSVHHQFHALLRDDFVVLLEDHTTEVQDDTGTQK